VSERDSYLTIPEVIAVLRVPRSTFYRWRQLGRGPRSIKLPNGDVRIRQSDLERWLRELEDQAA
jgi:excisionase family DNA binding protein